MKSPAATHARCSSPAPGEKAFCAGADIKELTGRSLVEQKRGAELGQATFAKLERLPMPSVAIINGYAFGGGLELALACTLRIATRNAKMGLPEIKLGLMPGYGGTQRLPRAVGEARAMEMILTGRTVDAEEALPHRPRAAPGRRRCARRGHRVRARILGLQPAGAGLRARSGGPRARERRSAKGLKIEADLSTLAFQTRDAAGRHGGVHRKAQAEVQ